MKTVKKYKFDIVFILFLIVIGFALLLLNHKEKREGAFVQVKMNGVVTQIHSLSSDKVVRIEKDGTFNNLVIKDGTAMIEDASCSDGLCVSVGKIKYVGQSIICVPNEIVIEIVGAADKKSTVDIIAG